MPSMEQQYQEAVDHGDIYGAILAAQDINGTFNYAKTFGQRTLLDNAKKPIQGDDIVNIFSSTKLLTTIAALQCVEKGKLSLDQPIYSLLPELEKLHIITGFDDRDQPQYEERKEAVTLGQLLTHSSGYSYEFMHPTLLKWRATRNELPMRGATVEARATIPLVFQPGTDWTYGYSVDWAGKMVERAMNTTLEEYFHEHIFKPLGIVDATFWPWNKEHIRARMVELNPEDPKGVGLAGASGFDMGNDHTDCFGGGGIYMSPVDYVKALHSLLANDGKLLQPASVDLMFEPHLTSEVHTKLNNQLKEAMFNEYFGQGMPAGTERDYGYGGMLLQENLPGWYQEGTMVWSGGVTLAWFIDRKSGLCGMVAPHLPLRGLPAQRQPGEEPKPTREGGMTWEVLTSHMKQVYRKGIYEVFEEAKRSH